MNIWRLVPVAILSARPALANPPAELPATAEAEALEEVADDIVVTGRRINLLGEVALRTSL